jgi:uncharacterized protein (DUF433 family)
MTSVSVLDREMYSEAEAARLLRVSQSTLHYWLEGGERRGRSYQPIIRPQPSGRRAPVTWAEFVEAGLLRSYRRDLGVAMVELRAFIDRLRGVLGVPYPLADRRPFASGKELVMDAQEASGLAPDLWLVSNARGQLMLLPPGDEFVRRVTWNGDEAAAWRPADDPDSPVLIEPDRRFGRPNVRGISTEAIWEHVDGGEAEDDVADDYGLTVGDVRWAISYESARRAG